MISSRTPGMLRLWHCFKGGKSLPFLVGAFILIFGSFLGLSDDEAYYWVLAQKPALGYAFHPPMVAWLLWISNKFFGGLFTPGSEILVRIPCALTITTLLILSQRWLTWTGISTANLAKSTLVLLSFSGFFALAWMMVPDIPLFLGITILFVSTWDFCERGGSYLKSLAGLFIGSAVVMLSKFSGILAVFSAFLCILAKRDKKQSWNGVLALLLGSLLGIIPTFIWNQQHHWASVLYQIRDRHGGGEISWIRFFRFWAVEALLAGPILIVNTIRIIFKGAFGERDRVSLFCMSWILPSALVFCIQPLTSDFKLHWAFVVWWPACLGLATEAVRNWKWIRYQVFFGAGVGFFILIACYLPVGGGLSSLFARSPIDPRWDVTNDLYGWRDLKTFINKEIDSKYSKLPILGGRYQTSSQAFFYLGEDRPVSFVPRSEKEIDEWSDIGVTSEQGPNWPKLSQSILFVADNRYSGKPEYISSSCSIIGRFEKTRFTFLAKQITLWKCDPQDL